MQSSSAPRETAHRSASAPVQPAVLMFAVAVITLNGCASAVDSAVFMPAAPAVRAEDVRIYSTQAPACAYDELGVVTWRPTNGWQKLQGGVDQMRARAAEMGGHAITGFAIGRRDIGTTTTTIRTDSVAVTTDTSVDAATIASGIVIRFRDGGCSTP